MTTTILPTVTFEADFPEDPEALYFLAEVPDYADLFEFEQFIAESESDGYLPTFLGPGISFTQARSQRNSPRSLSSHS